MANLQSWLIIMEMRDATEHEIWAG